MLPFGGQTMRATDPKLGMHDHLDPGSNIGRVPADLEVAEAEAKMGQKWPFRREGGPQNKKFMK